MERLTYRLKTGEVLMATEYEGKYTKDEWIGMLQCRLAAYEDTHMMPSDVTSMRMDMAIIAALFNGVDVDRMKELAEADKNGCVIIVPCKVGDTVYFALLGKIIEKQVFSIVAFSNSTRIYCGGTSEYFRPEDIGKTFFLTREEAEKALEAMKNE